MPASCASLHRSAHPTAAAVERIIPFAPLHDALLQLAVAPGPLPAGSLPPTALAAVPIAGAIALLGLSWIAAPTLLRRLATPQFTLA